MTNLRKAAEMALEALEWNYGTDLCDIENCTAWLDKMNATIPALRQALAQQEQEPVARVDYDRKGNIAWLYGPVEPDGTLLYTAPPKREWVGLTDEEEEEVLKGSKNAYDAIKRIGAKLKEKNT